MTLYSEISIQTRERCHWVDISSEVQRVVTKSGLGTGICLVSSMHTTAGITINENADPAVERDVFWKLEKLFPQNDGYRHSEGNSDSHLKASLIGLSASVPVNMGELVLGTWQGIYFCEFDGPRSRRVSVTLTGE
jgi:secondary thiamine-phosphate synthase enzyme